jgi:hypothetical protein
MAGMGFIKMPLPFGSEKCFFKFFCAVVPREYPWIHGILQWF